MIVGLEEAFPHGQYLRILQWDFIGRWHLYDDHWVAEARKWEVRILPMDPPRKLGASMNESAKDIFRRHLVEADKWKGFKRVSGRLTGPMPTGFKVLKSDMRLKKGDVYKTTGEMGQGNVQYGSKSGKVWYDKDDILMLYMKDIIEPTGNLR
jgi:hypothetical protein